MRELVIISGKGGTGKTSITAAFATLAENTVLCDADVDAADMHLLMAPTVLKRSDFKGGFQASINHDQCLECGICYTMCKFEAIDRNLKVNKLECEGCGVCVDYCPANAIDLIEKTCGEWYISETRICPMVHARLGVAEENSGKLVSLVRQEAKKLVISQNRELILTDGPPGVGCPVIASIGDATALVIVSEPTVSGIHDMERVVQLAKRFRVPAMVCVNKYDINEQQTLKIENYANQNGVRFLGRIPFDAAFTHAMVQGKTIFEYEGGSEAQEAIRKIWDTIIRSPEMNVLHHYEFN